MARGKRPWAIPETLLPRAEGAYNRVGRREPSGPRSVDDVPRPGTAVAPQRRDPSDAARPPPGGVGTSPGDPRAGGRLARPASVLPDRPRVAGGPLRDRAPVGSRGLPA